MIEPGTRFGPYEVTAALGSGGMGEVYRARDTRLERDVAIKVLPPGLQEDEERRQRFEREARTVSQLNHPHICSLYDVGQESERHYLVMELLEGESLADRVQKGPLPQHLVLRYGAEIAEALHAAHKEGITHRDLKPANVMLTKSGAKLLDFGLAKPASEGASPIEGLSHTPTEARPLTEKGSILGTFQYMAPEQLEGLEADPRTDIFALGTLLYEMATGRRAFEGGSKTSLIAAIVSAQPESIASVVPATPAALDHVVQKCLEKEPDDRWQSAHDVGSELRWVGEASPDNGAGTSIRLGRRTALRLLAAALVGVVAGVAGLLLVVERSTESDAARPPLRFVIEHGDFVFGGRPALSPDGQRVSYARRGSVWVRDLRELRPVRVPDTENGILPFWSPDGEWLGFSSEGRLWKIRLDGSGKTLLCTPAPTSDAGGAAWLPDGRIVFTTGASGLYEVPDRGGTARVVLHPGEGEWDFHQARAFPGGRGVFFVVHHSVHTFDTVVLWTGTERRTLFHLPGMNIGDVTYSPTGHLVFQRKSENDIWAVPFSADRLEVTGDPFRVLPSGLRPQVGANGTLVYIPLSVFEVASQIVVADRTGRVIRTVGEPRTGLWAPALSPDGRRVALMVASVSGADLWIYEVESGDATRLTFVDNPLGGMVNQASRQNMSIPAWTPAGDEVVQAWGPEGTLTLRAHPIDGSPPRDLGHGLSLPVLFPRLGETLVYGRFDEQRNPELWMREYAGESPGEPLLSGEGAISHLSISPDGRFLAYGQDGKVLVRSYPGMEGPWEVASGGARVPVWDPRGGRLYYLLGREVMEVSVTAQPTFRVGPSSPLFEFEFAQFATFAVAPDGESFVMLQAKEPVAAIVVVRNWLGLAE